MLSSCPALPYPLRQAISKTSLRPCFRLYILSAHRHCPVNTAFPSLTNKVARACRSCLTPTSCSHSLMSKHICSSTARCVIIWNSNALRGLGILVRPSFLAASHSDSEHCIRCQHSLTCCVHFHQHFTQSMYIHLRQYA